jgi:hypothetical protein
VEEATNRVCYSVFQGGAAQNTHISQIAARRALGTAAGEEVGDQGLCAGQVGSQRSRRQLAWHCIHADRCIRATIIAGRVCGALAAGCLSQQPLAACWQEFGRHCSLAADADICQQHRPHTTRFAVAAHWRR